MAARAMAPSASETGVSTPVLRVAFWTSGCQSSRTIASRSPEAMAAGHTQRKIRVRVNACERARANERVRASLSGQPFQPTVSNKKRRLEDPAVRGEGCYSKRAVSFCLRKGQSVRAPRKNNVFLTARQVI